MQPIYLDYNATTPVDPEVADAIVPFLRNHYGNPSSSHSFGRFCKAAIEEARQHVANLIGADPDEIYFTAGGTESNNLTIKGIFLKPGNGTGKFVTSCIEHPAIKKPAEFHQKQGGDVDWIPAFSHGVIDPEFARDIVDEQTKLVSVMHANNEIGTIQPIRQLVDDIADLGIPVHTDAAQSIGKVPVDVNELGVDFLTIAGHKLYAPKGVGALYVRKGKTLEPAVHGADHECGVRPGTENVPYIVGLGVAARLAKENLEESMSRNQEHRDRLEQELTQRIDGLFVNGAGAERLPNTSSLCFPDVRSADMLKLVPQLCVSTGAACHSDAVLLSDTLKAIGLNDAEGAGTIRVSCGRHTTAAEIDQAVALLHNAWTKAREQSIE